MIKICLIGIDGAGKTEHLLSLRNELEERGNSCKYTNLRGLHFRLFSLPLLMFLKSISKNNGRYPRHDTPSNIVKIWMFLFLLDIWLLAVFRGYFFPRRDVLLSDRGVTDSVIDVALHARDGDLLGHWVVNLFSAILKCDTFILLDIDAETAYERKKGNEELQELKLRRELYLEIADMLEIPVISSAGLFEDVHARLKKTLEEDQMWP